MIGGLPVVTFDDGVHVSRQWRGSSRVPCCRQRTPTATLPFYLMDSNVIIAGDLHFNYMFPFIDLDSGGTVRGYIAGMKKLIARWLTTDTDQSFPGHGELANKSRSAGEPSTCSLRCENASSRPSWCCKV